MSSVQKILFVRLIHPSTQLLIQSIAAILTVFRFNRDRSFYVWILTSCYDITTLAKKKLQDSVNISAFFVVSPTHTQYFIANRFGRTYSGSFVFQFVEFFNQVHCWDANSIVLIMFWFIEGHCMHCAMQSFNSILLVGWCTAVRQCIDCLLYTSDAADE